MMRLEMLILLLISLGFGSCAFAASAAVPREALTNDASLILKMRAGLASITDYMASRPDLFPPRKPAHLRALDAAQRQEVLDLWGRFLDYQLMLDSVWQRLREDPTSDVAQHDRTWQRTAYAAFLARYRHALDFIALSDADPALRVALNEPLPELGLPAGSYADFKFRFLNAAIATEFAALAAGQGSDRNDDSVALTQALRSDERRIWQAGKGDGIVNTLRNAGQIVDSGSRRLVFPVQKGVSEWMGDTRVLNGSRYLVTADQIANLAAKLQPGDVLLERREWFLSNIGLPGYWPHAALYIGTPEQRTAYFDDPAVRAWLASEGAAAGFDALLKARHPAAFSASQVSDAHGDRVRVIEAMSEGVVFTTLEHTAAADAVAVLRPRLSRLEVAKALLKAFAFQGRPYDFDFDFRSDATLVCTELVYKAYGPGIDKSGLRLPLRSVAGRPVLTANDIVRHFDATFSSPEQQFDLVAFLDGKARTGSAVAADLATFRASWKRPKWHILTQDAEPVSSHSGAIAESVNP